MTKEEVIISMGLDNSSLISGSKASRFILEESIQESLKSMKRLVAINAVELGQIAMEGWDKFTGFLANDLFQVDKIKAAGDAIGNWAKKLREARIEAEQLNKDLEKAKFEVASIEEKDAMLRERAAKNDAARKDTDAKIKHMDALMASMKQNKAFYESVGSGEKYTEELMNMEAERAKLANQAKTLAVEQLEIKKDQMKVADDDDTKRKQALSELVHLSNQKAEADKRIAENIKAQHKIQSELARDHTFTLADMAKADVLRGTRWGGMARFALQNEEWARNNRMLGFNDLAAQQQKRADQLYDQLKKENPFLRDPQREMVTDLKNQLEELRLINKNGVAIKQASQ